MNHNNDIYAYHSVLTLRGQGVDVVDCCQEYAPIKCTTNSDIAMKCTSKSSQNSSLIFFLMVYMKH